MFRFTKKTMFLWKYCVIWILFFEVIFAKIVVEIPNDADLNVSPMKIPINKTLSTSEFTICLQIKVSLSDNLKWFTFFRDLDDKLLFRAKFFQEYGFFHLDGIMHIFSIPGELFHPFSWYHTCLGFNETHYSLYSQVSLCKSVRF